MNTSRKFFGQWHWKVKGRLFGFGTSPEADWKIIFSSTAVLMLLTILLSILVFLKIYKGKISPVEKPAEQDGKILDLPLLREAVSYYQNKTVEFERIKGTKIPVVDPSL